MTTASREEKMLATTVELMSSRTAEIKNSLEKFISKLEAAPDPALVSCPSAMDSFGLISGQLTTVIKISRAEKAPAFRGRTLLPILLSPDRDEDLARATDNRIPAFSHDVVPDHLRTKLEPDIEVREQLFAHRTVAQETATKQINQFNKLTGLVVEAIRDQQDRSDTDATARARGAEITSSGQDTNALIAAITFGRGLRPPPGGGGMGPGGPPLGMVPSPRPGGGGGGGGGPGGPGGPPGGMMGGPPRGPPGGPMRPNIRVNMSARPHPYARH